jgi:type I restriction enzyme, S subunit
MAELYSLPDGWEWKTFDEVSTFIRGITFKPNEKYNEANENTIFCFRTTNIQTELDDSDLLNIDLSLIKSDEKLIKNGDILISSANSLELLGKCCLVRNITYKATLGGFIVCGRANPEVLDEKYYYYYFSSESNQNKMRNLANKTTGIANLPMKKVEKEYIPLPPLEEQKKDCG